MDKKFSNFWIIAVLAVTVATVNASTYIVTNTNDSGSGSLRFAIQQSNNSPVFDTIEFQIPGAGPHTIQPDSALPHITVPVTIDGYTQPGSQPNTNPVGFGLNTVLMIELDGSKAGELTHGLFITSGNCVIRGLVINRFWEGIHIEQNGGNHIAGNFIGTDVDGTDASGNTWGGITIFLASQWNTIGGTAPEVRNLISGNGDDGITVDNPNTSHNMIEGNLIGTDKTGTCALPNLAEGVSLFDTTSLNIIKNNLISGNGLNGIGIRDGCWENAVIGNFIGTDISGTTQLANAGRGILIANSMSNKIGGAESEMRNVISGNGQDGIYVVGPDAHHNWVTGNFIGTDITGTQGLGNGKWGVAIWSYAWQNYVGTNSDNEEDDAEGNLISGNGYNGVVITFQAERNVVAGNYIGTDLSGTQAVPNGVPSNRGGIEIANGARQNRIGTDADGISDEYERNIISGNTEFGINIFEGQYTGTEFNSIAGNYIGTDVTGTLPLPNLEGLRISAPGNAIGGTSIVHRNLISGNTTDGISLVGSQAIDNSIQGNFIGPDISGLVPLGNGGHGVAINSSSNDPLENLIGGYGDGERNLIAFNGQCGVAIVSGTNNEIAANFIHSNGELGIDLNGDGVTPNDPGDEDTGGNDLQNYPVLSSAANNRVWGSLSSTADQDFRIEFFSSNECDPSGYGEGQVFLDRMNVTTDSAGQVDFVFICPDSIPCGSYVTATATRGQNTSEFSRSIQMTCGCDFAVTHISMSSPVSVGYPTVFQMAVANLSLEDMFLGNAYIDIVDEWDQSVFEGGPQVMECLLPPPFLVPHGDTLYAYQYEWHPADAGTFHVQAFIVSECDTNEFNNTMDIPAMLVSGAGSGFLSYFDLFSPQKEPVVPEPNAGPAVRFTIPENLSGVSLRTLNVGVAFNDAPPPSTSFMVYLFGPGLNDSTFGEELIEPFEATPDSVDASGRMVIDLTDRPDFGNLIGLTGDFWVHLKATEETDFSWILRPVLPDTGVARNWYFIWSTPRNGWDRTSGMCPPPGGMNPIEKKKGWEEIIGASFGLCLLERGDANRDGKVNVLDVVAVVNHILGTVVIEDPETLCRADCNGDEQINVLDALGIVNVILGIGECAQ